MRLTFRKDFDCCCPDYHKAAIMPYTLDGEPIDKVISCSVESSVDKHTIMTIVVQVDETLDENIATNAAERMKK